MGYGFARRINAESRIRKNVLKFTLVLLVLLVLTVVLSFLLITGCNSSYMEKTVELYPGSPHVCIRTFIDEGKVSDDFFTAEGPPVIRGRELIFDARFPSGEVVTQRYYADE